MPRLAFLVIAVVLGAAIAGWFLTAAQRSNPSVIAGLVGDATRGERIFQIGGCASCHAAEGAEGEDLHVLAGGKRFPSPFGTFVAPNISPDRLTGIGNWTTLDLVTAMKHGTSPEGQHYYPAFPYTSYARAAVADIVDLKAFLDTLPVSKRPNEPHEIGFPSNIRRSLGGWKLLFFSDDPVSNEQPREGEAKEGQKLVEGLGHCGECHTPRGTFGNLKTNEWLRGAPNPNGKGRIPGLAPDQLKWSAEDIAEYLKSGFTPEFDTAGGTMVEVIENTSALPDADRAAIAAYLKSLPRKTP